MQVEAGASAVQLFDSWVGALPPRRLPRATSLPHSARVLAAVADLGVPRIHFGVGTGELLGAMGEAGADVVGVDFRVPLDEAVPPGRARHGRCRATSTRPSLFAPGRRSRPSAREVLRRGRAARATSSTSATASCRRPTPTSSPRVVDLVHETTAR